MGPISQYSDHVTEQVRAARVLNHGRESWETDAVRRRRLGRKREGMSHFQLIVHEVWQCRMRARAVHENKCVLMLEPQLL